MSSHAGRARPGRVFWPQTKDLPQHGPLWLGRAGRGGPSSRLGKRLRAKVTTLDLAPAAFARNGLSGAGRGGEGQTGSTTAFGLRCIRQLRPPGCAAAAARHPTTPLFGPASTQTILRWALHIRFGWGPPLSGEGEVHPLHRQFWRLHFLRVPPFVAKRTKEQGTVPMTMANSQ